jgi:hypothetical protein
MMESEDRKIVASRNPFAADGVRASRRAVLMGLAAAAAPAPAIAIGSTVSDPIFALIRAHQADMEAFLRACESGDEEFAASPDRWLFQILTAQPTTMDGVAALLAHVGQPENLVDQPDEDARQSILSGVSEANLKLKVAGRGFPARLAATVRALAALAPAGGPSSAPVVPDDPELLVLGERLEALLPELSAAQKACFAAVDAADEEAWRRAGLCDRPGDGGGDPLTEDEQSRRWAMEKVVRAELGTEDAIRACDEVWRRADIIHRQIIAQPARTLRGIAVKARAAAVLAMPQLWNEPAKDLDWHDEVARKLVESICDAAEMPLPYEAIETAPRRRPA